MCTVAHIDARAAGAFAVGNCGAYGFSYDYAEAEAAKRAAVAQCDGACTTVAVMRACAALAIDAGKACGAYGYATARKLHQLTEPLLKPVRRRMPVLGGLDLSPMIVLLGFALLQALLVAPLLDLGMRLGMG